MIVYFGREKKLLTIILLFDIRCIVDLLIKPSLSTSTTTTTKKESKPLLIRPILLLQLTHLIRFDSIRFFVSVVVVFLFFTPSTLNKTNKLTTTEKKTTLNGGKQKKSNYKTFNINFHWYIIKLFCHRRKIYIAG